MLQECVESDRKVISLRRRTLPEITEQGTIKIEVRRKRIRRLDKTVNMIVFVEHDKGNIPDTLEVLEEFGEQSFQCNGKTYVGNAYSISGIGQAVKDWVKSIQDIWVAASIPAPVWHQVMPEA